MASGPERDNAREDHFASPGRLLLTATAAVLAAQTVLTLAWSSPEPRLDGLRDALVLGLVLLPVLYFCIYRPARRHEAHRRRAREGLERSEERYRLLAEHAADVIWARELDLSVSYTSPSVERLRGFTAEEANAQTIDQTMPPESARLASETLARNVAWAQTATTEEVRGHSATLELELYRKDGSTVWTEVTVRFQMDPEGRPAKLVGVTRDITEWRRTQHALKESEQRFRVLFEQAGDAMFVQDWPSGQILDGNERACESLGYTREELLALSVSEIDSAWPRDKVMEVLGSLEPRRSVTVEGTFKAKDGHTFPVEIRIALIQMRGQRRVLAVARDVTERSRTERALRESAEWFEALSQAAFEGIAITEDGVFLEVNEQLARMARCSRDDMIGKSFLDFVPPEASQIIQERIRLGIDTPYRGPAQRSDGSAFSVEAHGRFMPFRGRTVRVTAFRDITGRQEMERALEESEARYRTVFEQGVVAVFLLKDLRFVECNSLCTDIFGCSREQLLGKTVIDVSPPTQPEGRASEEMARERFQAALGGTAQHFEWLHHRLDGTPFHAGVTLNRLELGGELHLQAVLADITEHKEMERVLEESEARYRTLFEQGGVAVAVLRDSCIVECNSRALEVFGVAREGVLGSTMARFSPPNQPDGRPSEKAAVERMRAALAGTPQRFEWEHLRSDGTPLHAHVALSRLELNGEPHVQAVLTDITERKEAEEGLRRSEHELRALFDHMLNGFAYHRIVTDEAGKPVDYVFLQCNAAYEKLTGLERGEILDKRVTEVLPGIEDSRFDWIGEFGRVALTGEPGHFEEYAEPLGRWFSVSAYSPARGYFAVTLENITERRESEEALRSLRQRVLTAQEEERRRIARELHDELGQALTGVKMDLAWLADRLRRDQPGLQERARASIALTDRTLDEVRDLSTRLRPPVLDDLGLLSAIEWQARHFARRTGVACDVSIGVDDLPLDGDRAIAVFRVFQEALTNVTRHAEAAHVEATVDTSDGEVLLEVRDDGRGVTQDQLASHKSLGLIGMRERAAAFGGAVEVHRAEEGGTAVTLRMPLAGTSR